MSETGCRVRKEERRIDNLARGLRRKKFGAGLNCLVVPVGKNLSTVDMSD